MFYFDYIYNESIFFNSVIKNMARKIDLQFLIFLNLFSNSHITNLLNLWN